MEWSDNQKKTGKVKSFLMHQKLTFGPLCFKAGNTLGHVVRKLDTFHWCCVLTSVACVCFIFFFSPSEGFCLFHGTKGGSRGATLAVGGVCGGSPPPCLVNLYLLMSTEWAY